MSGSINGLGWLEGRWLVMDMGDVRVKIKAEGLSQSDVDALNVGDIGTPKEERQKARDERVKEYLDATDLIDVRQKQREEEAEEKEQAIEEEKSLYPSQVVAREPSTLKRINLIAQVAKELNKAADEATAYINGIENYLAKMGYGIEVKGKCFAKARDKHAACPHLEYGKLNGHWCIILQGGKSPVQLLQASRTGKILAARHIPALLEKMWARVVEEAQTIAVEDENPKRIVGNEEELKREDD